jgi:UDP-glucose 4-epimerase
MVIVVIGAGFIGKHLIQALSGLGCEVRVLDHNQCPQELSSNLVWINGDYRDQGALCRVLENADVVYHLVSSTVPGDLHIEVAQELHDNVVASLRLLDLCLEYGVRRLVFLSSASVYGIQNHTPIDENAVTWPISFHGVHKLAIEKYLWIARHQRGLDVRVLRLANPYGPGQNIYGRQGFIAIAIGNLIRGEPIILRDGASTIRDFIYIDDVIDAMVSAGLHDKLPFIVNIGSGEGYSLVDVALIIAETSGRKLILHDEPSRSTDIPVSILNCSLAQEYLGHNPKVTLRLGIKKTLKDLGLLE